MTGCAALILAGGRGERLGGGAPKQYLALAGVALLRRAVLAFAHHPGVDLVRIVIGDGDRARYDESVAGIALAEPVVGGVTRQASALAGLESLADDPPERVLIHDAARPFVDGATISRVIAALDAHPAALPVLPVTDTLKRTGPKGAEVAATVERAGLVRAQTPQGFRFAEILAAHRAHAGEALTDDAAVAERAGLAVATVAGDEANIKITTEDDLARAEAAWAGGLAVPRMGTGFDVHRFGDGDHVMLCGVRVPSAHGLIGHSDADAGLHALTDALLGAIAEGDIGTHFPPSDARWKDASSDRFLAHARDLVVARGGEIASADVTLICELPRIGPHREKMRARIAEILGVPVGHVSVKATTTEGLGFAGRGEGLAVQAAAVVLLPRGR